jgi:hypothetical protein
MKIGITASIRKNGSIWLNGILQNTLMMYDLLQQIDFVEYVSVIHIGEVLEEYHYPLEQYNIEQWKNADQLTDRFDLIISLGAMPPKHALDKFLEKEGNKYVMYKGGNTLVNNMEMIMYDGLSAWPKIKNSTLVETNYSRVDEIWMVPQQEFHNKQYYEVAYNTKSRVVPFVWSSKFIEEDNQNEIKNGNKSAVFNPENIEKWKVVSFEPNMGLLKNMIPITWSIEHAYKTNKDWLDVFISTNAKGLMKNKQLLDTVKNLEIAKDKKLKLEPRWTIVTALAKFTDMVVSHQWGNPLNYAYLDAVYFGYPLVHNAHLCRDIGYYYEGFNVKDAGDQIIKVTKQHINDTNYLNRQREIIKRYTIENTEMVKQYGRLIKNLYDKNEIEDKRYDWKTNTLE